MKGMQSWGHQLYRMMLGLMMLFSFANIQCLLLETFSIFQLLEMIREVYTRNNYEAEGFHTVSQLHMGRGLAWTRIHPAFQAPQRWVSW